MLENSNHYRPKDKSYQKHKQWGLPNYCKECSKQGKPSQEIPKGKTICMHCAEVLKQKRLEKKKEERKKQHEQQHKGD